MTWLHRFAILLAASTVVLVLLGAVVTSTGSGLTVPAWPSTFGDPAGLGSVPSGVRLQQAHRVVAALVGLLMFLVAAFTWRVDRRPWMMGLTTAGIALVVAQAVYGGIGVLNSLPAYFTVFHAALAQLFLALTFALALFTSRGWLARTGDARAAGRADRALGRLAIATTATIYLQVLLGAAMRHGYTPDGRPAGFAIPDYPLAFGQVVPWAQLASWSVVADFLHRVTALAVVALGGVIAVRVFRRHVDEDELVRPAAMLALVVVAQVALGGLTVLSGGHPAVSATHAGAVTAALGAALVLALRSFGPGPGATLAASQKPAAPGTKGATA